MSARDVDPSHLHPTFRKLNADLLALVQGKGLPIEPFEMWRSPDRQALLYTEGRVEGVGTPGRKVTYEMAWQSLHQYGLACDWVWYFNGAWSWTPPAGHSWDEFHLLAAQVGLTYLNFEQPHIQLQGISARDILSGAVPYPSGGDDSWEENIEAAIVAWGRAPKTVSGIVMPGAPPLVAARPPLVA